MNPLLRIFINVIIFCSASILAFDPFEFVFAKPVSELSFSTRLIEITDIKSYFFYTALVLIAYVSVYFIVGSALEYSNPTPKTEERVASTKKQMMMGFQALLYVVSFTTLWLWKVDPLTHYYGYYETTPYSFKSFFLNLFIYLFVFDTWFYWTHRLLHLKFFWNQVHHVHHQFLEPTAFAQDAVHWFEGILQGPMGHVLTTLVYPMHPIAVNAFGFLTSIYALLAHDGRILDLNDHMKHHHYKSCNFGLYWGFWDYLFDTRYSRKKFPDLYIPSWLRNNEESVKKEQELQKKEFQEEKIF